MAEGGQEMSSNEDENGSWWDKWLKSAKEKSSTTLEFIKKDLTEFSQTVQQDTASAISSTASFLKDQLRVDDSGSVAGKAKEGLNLIWGTIADAFIPPKELEDTELCVIQNSETVVLDRWQTKLRMIQVDPQTYCREPEGPPEEYETWLMGFKLDEDEAKHVMASAAVKALYEELVPSVVSHTEFWQRYFYRVHCLKRALVDEANLSAQQNEDGKTIANEQKSGETFDNLSSSSALNTTSKPDSTSQKEGVHNNANDRVSSVNERTVPVAGDALTTTPQKKSSPTDSDSGRGDTISRCSNSSPKEAGSFFTKDKGDVVMVCPTGSAASSSISPNSNDSNSKESTEDDWEKDFDLDGIDTDKEKSSASKTPGEEEDWESWG